MWNRLHTWLNQAPIEDPIERRQAPMVQVLLIALAIAAIVGAFIAIGDPTLAQNSAAEIGVALLFVVSATISFALIRRGRFKSAVLLTTSGLLLIMASAIVISGSGGNEVLFGLALPIVMAGLSGRRSLWLTSSAVVLAIAFFAFLGEVPQGTDAAARRNSPITTTADAVIIAGLLSMFVDRFRSSMRAALADALEREQELLRLRVSLESSVAERTAALQEALQEGERRETRLADALADLQASQDVIRELSAPVIPVLDGVLVAPLIGALDSTRAAALSANILAAVERAHVARSSSISPACRWSIRK